MCAGFNGHDEWAQCKGAESDADKPCSRYGEDLHLCASTSIAIRIPQRLGMILGGKKEDTGLPEYLR